MSPEQSMLESETDYRQLFNAVADAIITLDPATGRIHDANENAARLYGWSVTELKGMTMPLLSAEPEKTRASIAEVGEKGHGDATRLHKRRDGSVFHAEIHATAFGDRGSCVIIAAIRDVSARVVEAEKLRESRSFLEQAQTVASVGSWVYDVAADDLLGSRECCRILGTEPGKRVSKAGFFAILHPDDRGRVAGLVAAALESGEFYEAEYRLAGERASRRILARAAVVRDEDGRAVKMIGVVRDVTEEREKSARLESTEQQLRQAQKMEAVGRLAGGVAHDFNNILTAILGLTEMSIAALPADSPVRADLAEVRASTLRAANLTHQLLAFSRRQPIRQKIVDLDESVLGVSKMLKRIIGEDVDLIVAGESGARVLVDPGQLEQLAANLAVNARDAMPEGGRLTISTATAELDAAWAAKHEGLSAGRYATLVVSDSGTGMSPEVQSHLFEPFFTTKGLGKGTGLGLATCYGIARQNGGTIVCDSVLGWGTTFTVYLPVQDGQADAEGGDDEAALSRGTERILIVEDEKPVRQLVLRVLGGLGYDILQASDGVEALSVLREDGASAIRLIVTDMVMPELGGRRLSELVSEIRPDVRVLFTSGYTDDMIDGGTPESGMDFMMKPFSSAELAARVRRALDA